MPMSILPDVLVRLSGRGREDTNGAEPHGDGVRHQHTTRPDQTQNHNPLHPRHEADHRGYQ
jgi:hypothetical protein